VEHVSIDAGAPTGDLFVAKRVRQGHLDWQRSLVAAIGVHNPETPCACFSTLSAVAQKNNLIAFRIPGRRYVARNHIHQRRLGVCQRAATGSVGVDAEYLPVTGLFALVDNDVTAWLPIWVMILVLQVIEHDDL